MVSRSEPRHSHGSSWRRPCEKTPLSSCGPGFLGRRAGSLPDHALVSGYLTTFVLHTFPPSVTREAAKDYDALLERALASFVTGEDVGAAGLASQDEVRTNHSFC